MQKALQKIVSLFTKTTPLPKKNARKSRGQSLVEVAIAFPVLIMLFTGVVEFGFILNFYLSLLDATRDSARLYSGDDPFKDDPLHPGTRIEDEDFYYQAAYLVQRTLDPLIDDASYRGRRIVLDPALDDVIVSVYSSDATTTVPRRAAGPYHLFATLAKPSGNYPSIFTATDIANTRVSGAPNAGVLMVEIHYNYHHILSLPWMTAFLPNPLHLRAYTIMPIRAAEPPATP
jgi:hypothetical protein